MSSARIFDGEGAGDARGPARDPDLIGEGISINITLLFSQKVYVQVSQAYLAGLEKYVAKGGDPSHVASVASFFRQPHATARSTKRSTKRSHGPTILREGAAGALKGKIAIATPARLPGIQAPVLRDAVTSFGQRRQAQRLLWASTGTKNKDYSDVLYVEELIAPTPSTPCRRRRSTRFRDHGTPRDSLRKYRGCEGVLAELETSGISLDASRRSGQGRRQSVAMRRQAYGAVPHKRAACSGLVRPPEFALGSSIGKAVEKSTEDWARPAKIRRLWQHDKSVWTGTDDNKWLAG